ncbi:MAG: PAAR domain-containing protein [Bacteroidetes bacterium]|nr:PAAR domain-containing protein [Fibrella sp.]
MGKPAARVGDMHVCPIPIHVGGPILPPGKPTVWIGGLPAATVGSMCTCVGPPDVIIQGSMSVFIGGMPAARMGDMTAHGGRIVMGCPTVLIGDFGMGGMPVGMIPDLMSGLSTQMAAVVNQITTLVRAAQNGTPFCEQC